MFEHLYSFLVSDFFCYPGFCWEKNEKLLPKVFCWNVSDSYPTIERMPKSSIGIVLNGDENDFSPKLHD